MNVIPNGLEKCMSFIIKNELSFIDSFQHLSSSLDSLVKNLSKDLIITYYVWLSKKDFILISI